MSIGESLSIRILSSSAVATTRPRKWKSTTDYAVRFPTTHRPVEIQSRMVPAYEQRSLLEHSEGSFETLHQLL